MTYKFIAVHLEVTMSKRLVGKSQTFVGCQVLLPGTGVAPSSRALSRDWGDWGQWDQLGCPGDTRLVAGEGPRLCWWIKNLDRHFSSQVCHANPPAHSGMVLECYGGNGKDTIWP